MSGAPPSWESAPARGPGRPVSASSPEGLGGRHEAGSPGQAPQGLCGPPGQASQP